MAVPRAQRGGQFGGGVQAEPNRGVNVSSIVDAVIGGTSNAFHMAALRRIQQNRDAAAAKLAAEDRAARERDRQDAITYRDSEAKYRREQDALALDAARQKRTMELADGALRQQNDEYDRQRQIEKDAYDRAQPKAPVPGTKEWERMIETQARINARFQRPAAAPQPQVLQGNDGNLYQVIRGANGVAQYVRVPEAGVAPAASAPAPTAGVGPVRQLGNRPAAADMFGTQANPFQPYGGPANGGAPPQQEPAQGAGVPQRVLGNRGPFGRSASTSVARIPPAFATSAQTFGSMESALNNYERLLDSKGTSAIIGSSPDAASVASAYQATVMQLKNLNDLGVLNGRDYELLQEQLQGPTGLKSVYRGKEAIKAQIAQVRQVLRDKKRTLYEVYQQPMPPDEDPALSNARDPLNIFGGPPE